MSGFPPQQCVREEQQTCPAAVSHPQDTTTVLLPNSWPSYQTPNYLVGKTPKFQLAKGGTGQVSHLQTIQGGMSDTTAQPLVILGEGGQGPTDGKNLQCCKRCAAPAGSASPPASPGARRKKYPAFPRPAAAPAPTELTCREGGSPSSPQLLVAAGAVFPSSWREMICGDRNARAGSQGRAWTAWGPRG